MKLRAYALVNQYIAGIHAGIQTAHALMELVNKYEGPIPQSSTAVKNLRQWRNSDKTLIVLDGGYQKNIYAEMEVWNRVSRIYPSASFCEEQDALNGALTAAVIIVPEYIYKYDVDLDDGTYCYEDGLRVSIGKDSREVAKGLRKYRLKGA